MGLSAFVRDGNVVYRYMLRTSHRRLRYRRRRAFLGGVSVAIRYQAKPEERIISLR